jgi:hypothetical protein
VRALGAMNGALEYLDGEWDGGSEGYRAAVGVVTVGRADRRVESEDSAEAP